MVQYRGEVMRVLDIEELLGTGGAGPPRENDQVHVLVHGVGRRQLGLRVGRIVDIVAEPLELRRTGAEHRAPGVLGCAVIHQTVTEVLDLGALLAAALPDTREEVTA